MLVDFEAMREVEYDAGSRILHVLFADGRWWRYFDVPAQVHAALIAAESQGRYFHEQIRHRFDYERC